MRKTATILGMIGLGVLAGCQDDAKIASQNLSKAADNFEVNRRVVFMNGITGSYELEVVGRCSTERTKSGRGIAVTCKTGPRDYKKHLFYLSDNTSVFAEQLEASDVSVYHSRITFKPQQIIPDIDFRGDVQELAPRDQ